MSDLRFFASLMHEAIYLERQKRFFFKMIERRENEALKRLKSIRMHQSKPHPCNYVAGEMASLKREIDCAKGKA